MPHVMTQTRRLRRQPFVSVISSLLCILIVFTLTGCTRSVREDATKVAQAGDTVSKQMAEYYSSLQQDTVDTYELNAFREAYLLQQKYDEEVKKDKKQGRIPLLPPSFEMSLEDKEIAEEYQKAYRALAARVRLARAMQDAYGSYAHLSEYDSTKEVLNNVGGLIKAVNATASLSLPDPTGTVSMVVQGLFKDIVTELTIIQQNRKLLRESNRLIPILQKVKQVFDAEMILCGGDTTVKNSEDKDMRVSGIAGRRAAAYKSVARQLVESDAVITTALVNGVLSQYQLRWPEPQMPFTQSALKAGIVKMIEARAYPLTQLSEDAGEGVSRGLDKLIVLHQQLAVRKPLSLQEVESNSATLQVLLDQLKTKGVPTDFITELLKTLQKGA
ncbi:MAG: hypothetical protein Q8O45_06565 [Desulfurivibrionaceae bacterium]|nr:hypothetical protein [Desulfurivibrionaceae bacterium]